MNPQPNSGPSIPAVNTFTRRSFMKTSALTVGAVALLSQGKALATGGGNSSSGPLVNGSKVVPTHVHLNDFYGGVTMDISNPNPGAAVTITLKGYGAKAQTAGDPTMPPLNYTGAIVFAGARGKDSNGNWYLQATPGCTLGQNLSAQIGNLPGLLLPGAAVDVVVIVTGITTANSKAVVSGTVHLETRAIFPVQSTKKDWSMVLELK